MGVLGDWGGALRDAADELKGALGAGEDSNPFQLPATLSGTSAVDYTGMGVRGGFAAPNGAPATSFPQPGVQEAFPTVQPNQAFPDYSRLGGDGAMPEMKPINSFDDFSRLAGGSFDESDLRDLYAQFDANAKRLQASKEARAAAAAGQAGGGYSNTSGGGDPSGARGIEGALKWKDLATKVAATVGIPWQIIIAVMGLESGGNQYDTSVAGAQGLMQVMPFHFGSGDDMTDPYTNVLKGAQILKEGYDRYGSWDKAFAAYLGAIDSQGNITDKTDAYGTDGNTYVQIVNNNLAYLGFGGTSGGNAGTTGNERLDSIVTAALSAQGHPYVWGGDTFDGGFDCSGLIQWAYAQGNVALPRTAQEQYGATQRISKDQLRNGDLVFYTQTYDGAPTVSHVGIYINGKVLNAVKEGDTIRFVELDDPWWSAHIYGFGRVPMGATLSVHKHTGVDRPAQYGQPVNAVKGGMMIGRGVHPDLGQYAVLFDGHHFFTYGHLDHEGIPAQDEWVDAGQRVGRVGSGGTETGPHTHLDIHDPAGNPVDPWQFVRL